jgi:2-dehydro-3-deoxyphosphogluconate aldolase / (4S)-4-hydroxy-2-oxoglutarate aldolase
MQEVLQTLGRFGVVPVIKIDDVAHAIPLAEALIAGDMPVAEITFRTGAAAPSIRDISRKFPNMLVGAGTVLTVSQAQQAVDAGARYIVSPGFSPSVAEWCLQQQVPVLPGVATPTEIIAALDAGLTVLKFFPTEELGGVRMLKALASPFSAVKFVPTGGVTPASLPDYLRLPNVLAVGGTWMVKSDLISASRFDEITRLALEARGIVKQLR